MRYSDVATLFKETTTQDSMGNIVVARDNGTVVYANTYNIGTSAFMEAKSAGLHADAEIEIRACDYANQNIVVMESKEYDVERVNETGEFVRLTLAKRLDND